MYKNLQEECLLDHQIRNGCSIPTLVSTYPKIFLLAKLASLINSVIFWAAAETPIVSFLAPTKEIFITIG